MVVGLFRGWSGVCLQNLNLEGLSTAGNSIQAGAESLDVDEGSVWTRGPLITKRTRKRVERHTDGVAENDCTKDVREEIGNGISQKGQRPQLGQR